MDIDNCDVKENYEKKAPSIFDLMEKSTKKEFFFFILIKFK